ncbi:hypothetical protein [uncultured Enterovirga sp.]|uniref:hypothetical protein n=1 Tax=uncultured Enterovirga sp. TaxID=2026352 RepID=UPI0035CA5576
MNETMSDGAGDPKAVRAECRALVVHSQAAAGHGGGRPLAGFIAQLIACHRRLPAFRKVGRATPAVLRDIYILRRAPAASRLDLEV